MSEPITTPLGTVPSQTLGVVDNSASRAIDKKTNHQAELHETDTELAREGHIVIECPKGERRIFWSDLCEAAVRGTPYSWDDVTGPSRVHPLVRIRQAICFFLMSHPNYRGWSLKTMGKVIARDHTTVMHNQDWAWDAMHSARKCPDFWEAVDRLMAAEEVYG